MRPTRLFPILLFFLFGHVFAQNGWFWQYPKPQGNTLRDIFVLDQNTAVAVGDVGTVIKTTDGGGSWSVQHHAGGTSYDLCGVHFVGAMTGWAAGGTRQLSINSNVLLKTVDGGESWAEVSTGLDSLNFNAVYFIDADTGFVVGEDGILLRTTDGGSSWDKRTIDDYIGSWLDVFDLTAVTFTDQHTGWIVGGGYYGNQIYKTTDCGRTWQWNEYVISPKVFDGFNDICFVDEHHGFVAGYGGAFLRTTDGGTTWQYQNLSEKYQKEEYQYFYSICFTDSAAGWIVGGNGTIDSHFGGVVLTTKDGGENWAQVDSSKNVGQLLKVRFSGGSTGWIIGQSGLILKTTDSGLNWVSQRQREYSLNSIYFVNENTGWAVGEKGVVLHTTNGGADWDKQNENDSLLLSSVYGIDTQNVFAVGAVIKGLSIYDREGVVVRSTNGGQMWARQIFDTLYGFNSILFVTDSAGWLSVSDGTLLKTSDKGNTWTEVALDTAATKATGRIRFVSQTTGWVGGTLKTTDGGESWFPQVIPVTSLDSYDFVYAEIGWAVATYSGESNVLKTTDGGENWTPCSITPPGYNFSMQFVSETTGWISGFDNLNRTSLIIKTTDGGHNWIEQQSPCKNEGGLSSVLILDENTGWAVGDGIIKTTDGGGIVSVGDTKESTNSLPVQMILFQNYPNPFNLTTVISFRLSRASFVSLRVYDLLGRLVNTLVEEWMPAGEHKTSWEAEGSTSGLYFCRLQAGESVQVRKMILIR